MLKSIRHVVVLIVLLTTVSVVFAHPVKQLVVRHTIITRRIPLTNKQISAVKLNIPVQATILAGYRTAGLTYRGPQSLLSHIIISDKDGQLTLSKKIIHKNTHCFYKRTILSYLGKKLS